MTTTREAKKQKKGQKSPVASLSKHYSCKERLPRETNQSHTEKNIYFFHVIFLYN